MNERMKHLMVKMIELRGYDEYLGGKGYDEVAAFEDGFEYAHDLLMKDVNEVLKFCEPHLEFMWAARIVGILLHCDFRDSKEALAEWNSKYGDGK